VKLRKGKYFDHNKNLWAPQTCAYATLRQSVANLMFLNVSFNFATAITKFDTFSSYHIVRTQISTVTNFFPFCTIGISMHQKLFLPYFIIPSTFSPQASSPLSHHRQTEGRTTFFTPCYLSYFIPLSARGPTRRRNSTGLAELWGGWPIELGGAKVLRYVRSSYLSIYLSVCLSVCLY
jgi:hypothetical protein